MPGEWKSSTCERCQCPYDAKENAMGALGGHSPDQCIASLLEANHSLRGLIAAQKKLTSEYVAKWFDLFLTEIKHDIDEGVLYVEDLEPYLSQIAELLQRK